MGFSLIRNSGFVRRLSLILLCLLLGFSIGSRAWAAVQVKPPLDSTKGQVLVSSNESDNEVDLAIKYFSGKSKEQGIWAKANPRLAVSAYRKALKRGQGTLPYLNYPKKQAPAICSSETPLACSSSQLTFEKNAQQKINQDPGKLTREARHSSRSPNKADWGGGFIEDSVKFFEGLKDDFVDIVVGILVCLAVLAAIWWGLKSWLQCPYCDSWFTKEVIDQSYLGQYTTHSKDSSMTTIKYLTTYRCSHCGSTWKDRTYERH